MKPYLSIRDCQLLNDACLQDSPLLVNIVIHKQRYFYHHLKKLFNYNPMLERQAFIRMAKLMMVNGSFNALSVLLTDTRFFGREVAPNLLGEAVYAMQIPRYSREMDCDRLIAILCSRPEILKYPVPFGLLGHVVRLRNHELAAYFVKRQEVSVQEQDHNPFRQALVNLDIPMLDILLGTDSYAHFFKRKHVANQYQNDIGYAKMINLILQYALSAKKDSAVTVASFIVHHPCVRLNEDKHFVDSIAKKSRLMQSKLLSFRFRYDVLGDPCFNERNCEDIEDNVDLKLGKNVDETLSI